MDKQGVNQMEFLPGGAPLRHGAAPHARRIEQQLIRYFQNPTCPIDIALHPAGTSYQQRVWQALIKIPVGATTRYGELAEKLASGPRAIAAACRSNPIPILIPCHRVVAKAGLGGYMGETQGEALSIKQWLLQHEGAI
jgi:methylated-DNA-[protein]-cysteine S-methyltransferase